MYDTDGPLMSKAEAIFFWSAVIIGTIILLWFIPIE